MAARDSGMASIGLTLANIAVILPHLRQPIFDSIHAHKVALAHERDIQEQINLPLDKPNSTPVDLNVENSILASVSPCVGGPQSSLPYSASTKSADSQVALSTTLLPPCGTIDDCQILHPLGAGFSERHVTSHLFVRQGRDALHIPLPVPDAAEVAFFDTEDVTLSDYDQGEEFPLPACDQHTVPEERPTAEGDGRISMKDDQPVTVNLPCTHGRIEIAKELAVMSMNIASTTLMSVGVRDHEGTVSDHPDGVARGIQTVRETHTLAGGKEALAKRRPECLDFVPQSVITRYPPAPMTSRGRCFVHRAIGSRHDHHQVTAAPPHVFVHNPVEESGTRYMTLEWPRLASVPTPTGRSLDGQMFIETAPIQDPPEQGPASIPKLTTASEPTHGRGLTTRGRTADEIDGSFLSDSDSDCESDSRYSSGSSADESMLPHILGADLIAAIDANSESGLHLSRSRRVMHYVYEDFLMSENSAADVSMVMHAPSVDEVSDGEVGVPATFRSLTYEDIQQWASGVVQKCVGQVCSSRVSAEPSSPSQASDVCAERPCGSGVSQCPLAGLHCKLGAATLTGTPAPRIKGLPVLVPPTHILPSRKPLPARNLRDIPEFVPRQRQVSVIAGCAEGPRRRSTRPSMNVARDAATRVIARVESRAGFNARQWLVGTEERRMASTAGGRQGTLRCA